MRVRVCVDVRMKGRRVTQRPAGGVSFRQRDLPVAEPTDPPPSHRRLSGQRTRPAEAKTELLCVHRAANKEELSELGRLPSSSLLRASRCRNEGCGPPPSLPLSATCWCSLTRLLTFVPLQRHWASCKD